MDERTHVCSPEGNGSGSYLDVFPALRGFLVPIGIPSRASSSSSRPAAAGFSTWSASASPVA